MTKSIRKVIVMIIIFLSSLFVCEKTLAAFSFQISEITPNTISSKEDEITVGISITDLPSESYFRVAFQKSDGSVYFGYFKNSEGNWIKTSENCTNFFRVTDKTASHIEIALKVGDNAIDSGEYNVKAHRYTSSCSSTAATNSQPIDIVLPTSTPTPIPSPTSSISNAIPTPSMTPTPSLTPSPTSDPTPSPTTPADIDNIYISEVMINPQSGGNEWVEIYNGNDNPVTLADWFMDDEEDAGATPKKFSMEIGAQSYKVLILSNFIFNNDGDSVRLLDSDKNFVDGFEYGKSVKGLSYGRVVFENSDFCLQEESFEKSNNQCVDEVTVAPTDKTIMTADSASPTIPISKVKPTKKVTIKAAARSAPGVVKPSERPGSYEEILGASDNRTIDYDLLIKHLSVVSFAYSLLTLVSVLFKMTGIYGKGFRFLPAFIHPPRGQ